MRIYRDLDFELELPTVATIGIFDGVHLAHQLLLERVHSQAKKYQAETVLVTFDPHPRTVLNTTGDKSQFLTTLSEKIRLIDHYKVDHLVIIPFNIEFSQVTAEQFIFDILVKKLNVKHLILGYDHHFGRNREGHFQYLQQRASSWPFGIEEVSMLKVNELPVSSTQIRKSVLSKDFEQVKAMLGRFYRFGGTVVKGNQLGRTIGFPTANIFVEDSHKMLPPTGVYAVLVEIVGEVYQGMLNIGYRPTINGKNLSVEVNILNFDRDIYGEMLTVRMVKWIRGEVKFDGLEALKTQLKLDQITSAEILNQLTS